MRKSGNKLRITAQLVNVADGYHLWSERYDREMEDIFDIQDEISQAILDKLKPILLRDEKAKLGRCQPVNLTAYNLYLRGRWFADRRTAASLKKAMEQFERAIEKQPNYAQAYAGLADCYNLLSMFGPFAPKEVFPKAREAASKALEIDNTLAEAHTSLGMCKDYYDWDWEGAEREYRRAVELNPGYATAHHQYAMYLARTSRFAKAIKEMERALELDPLSLIINNQMGMVYYFAGEYEKAVIASKKTIEMDPDFLGARFVLGSIYLRKHMYEEAVEQMGRGEKVKGEWEPPRLMMAGCVYALTGRRGEAEKLLKGLLERSEEEYVPPVYLAVFYFLLGEVDKGFTWLDKAYDERDTWMCFMKVHPALDFFNLRSDPRYIAMLKKIGLEK